MHDNFGKSRPAKLIGKRKKLCFLLEHIPRARNNQNGVQLICLLLGVWGFWFVTCTCFVKHVRCFTTVLYTFISSPVVIIHPLFISNNQSMYEVKRSFFSRPFPLPGQLRIWHLYCCKYQPKFLDVIHLNIVMLSSRVSHNLPELIDI